MSDMELGFKCADGKKLKVATEFNFAMAGFAVAVTASGGKFSGAGVTGPTGLRRTQFAVRIATMRLKRSLSSQNNRDGLGVCVSTRFPRNANGLGQHPEVNIKYNFRFAVEFATATLFLPHPVFVLRIARLKPAL